MRLKECDTIIQEKKREVYRGAFSRKKKQNCAEKQPPHNVPRNTTDIPHPPKKHKKHYPYTAHLVVAWEQSRTELNRDQTEGTRSESGRIWASKHLASDQRASPATDLAAHTPQPDTGRKAGPVITTPPLTGPWGGQPSISSTRGNAKSQVGGAEGRQGGYWTKGLLADYEDGGRDRRLSANGQTPRSPPSITRPHTPVQQPLYHLISCSSTYHNRLPFRHIRLKTDRLLTMAKHYLAAHLTLALAYFGSAKKAVGRVRERRCERSALTRPVCGDRLGVASRAARTPPHSSDGTGSPQLEQVVVHQPRTNALLHQPQTPGSYP
ncbi:hypothetical protein AAG570_012404 [Ranatra chinensis]|uniref:Uncharacterized protein n=1 Tax=Ranatra chinensis TaxID=642074 RepID=A0ABD0Z506_9HEMI